MIPTAGLALALTLMSGLSDAYAFTHASRTWRDGAVVTGELGRASLGFAAGVATYLLALRYLEQLGVRSAIPQTLGWFGVSMVGVALISGELTRWSETEQIVALLTSLGIAWLLARTAS